MSVRARRRCECRKHILNFKGLDLKDQMGVNMDFQIIYLKLSPLKVFRIKLKPKQTSFFFFFDKEQNLNCSLQSLSSSL
jgi:hypothetical protein